MKLHNSITQTHVDTVGGFYTIPKIICSSEYNEEFNYSLYPFPVGDGVDQWYVQPVRKNKGERNHNDCLNVFQSKSDAIQFINDKLLSVEDFASLLD